MPVDLIPPPGFDWKPWIDRWERMQDSYFPARSERIETIIHLVRVTRPDPQRILDLGCGTGSLTVHLLDNFPNAQVVGIDFDPVMLLLAQMRLASYGGRGQVKAKDLRDPSWSTSLGTFDAVVSMSALHWLAPDQLVPVYREAARLLIPGAIFLNADHVGSDFAPIQNYWDRERSQARVNLLTGDQDWDEYWKALAQALHIDVDEIHGGLGGWTAGVEYGLPLPWHLHELKASGIRHVDCFWRNAGDAIYGGIRSDSR